MKIVKTLFNILLFSFVIGCQYKYDIENFQEKIVVNAILYPDSINVRLSKTVEPTEEVIFKEEKLLLKDATVTLIDKTTNQVFDLNHTEKGRYKFKGVFQSEPNHLYQIQASSDGLPTVLSDVVLMPTIPLISYENIISTPPLNQNGEKAKLIQFQLLNESNKRQYSSIFRYENDIAGLRGNSQTQDLCDVKEVTPVQYFSNKCLVSGNNLLNYFCEYTIFNPYATVIFSNISESLFQYYDSIEQPRGLDSAFSEPNPNYSNIQNGYGVFVAVNSKKFIFKF